MALATNVFTGSGGGTLNGGWSNSLTAFFKTRFPQKKVDNLVAWGNPFYSEIKKSDELTGIQTVVPLQIGNPQGISATLTSAIQNASSIVGKAWVITPGQLYGGMRIDSRTLMAARNDEGAFFRIREREYEGILKTFGLAMEQYLWGTGSASQGIASATITTGAAGTVLLATPADALNFQIGMEVRFYDDDAAGGPDPTDPRVAGVASSTVTASNLITGVVAFDSVPTDVVVGDHLVRDGDIAAGALVLTIKGVQAWIPAADPSATLFFGVDRTAAVQMLSGWREPTYLGSIEETALSLVSKMDRVSKVPKTLWLSYANWNKLNLELGARGVREEDGGEGVFGRSSLKMSTPAGMVRVRAGAYVPETAGFLLDMSSWELRSLGKVPHIVEDDGLTARVVGVASNSGVSMAEDGIEIRLRAFPQLICLNPFANGRFPIS